MIVEFEFILNVEDDRNDAFQQLLVSLKLFYLEDSCDPISYVV